MNPETPSHDESSTTAYAAELPAVHEPPACPETAGAGDVATSSDLPDVAWSPYPPVEPPDPIDRPRNRVLVGLGVAVVVALLGVPLAYLWSAVAPWLPAQVSGNELIYADPTGEQRAAAESIFVLIMIGTGIIVALIVWFALRRFRGSVMIGALAIGASVAGWLTWRIGHTIGMAGVQAKEQHATDGEIILLPPALRVKSPGNLAQLHVQFRVGLHSVNIWIPYVGGVLLYMALAAVCTYVIAVLVTVSPALNRRRPNYDT